MHLSITFFKPAWSSTDAEEDQVNQETLAQHHQTWHTGCETIMARSRRTYSRQERMVSMCDPVCLWCRL